MLYNKFYSYPCHEHFSELRFNTDIGNHNATIISCNFFSFFKTGTISYEAKNQMNCRKFTPIKN